ncbi:MAG TPA: Rieske (2Fe-2S) protein [Haliscomenobacter sp.]|uniref:Rieske (2Fe-2S) protein n=1 Tax=Haliscomenobacter sp. TaxID=2717303 RepID=UPI002CDB5978|nr:Rieske (2Fe-2S) protein [Haliscomenobacter sp.]HOY21391.1 Rieske (2Fe-2S) protein [Haliscomenobacter sp.]
MKTKYYFDELTALQEGYFIIRQLGNHSVGATIHEGKPIVLLDYCPHAGAPICKGKILPKPVAMQLEENHPVLRCPWHGWEFNMKSGDTFKFHSNLRLPKLQYELENDSIYIWI